MIMIYWTSILRFYVTYSNPFLHVYIPLCKGLYLSRAGPVMSMWDAVLAQSQRVRWVWCRGGVSALLSWEVCCSIKADAVLYLPQCPASLSLCVCIRSWTEPFICADFFTQCMFSYLHLWISILLVFSYFIITAYFFHQITLSWLFCIFLWLLSVSITSSCSASAWNAPWVPSLIADPLEMPIFALALSPSPKVAVAASSPRIGVDEVAFPTVKVLNPQMGQGMRKRPCRGWMTGLLAI